MSCNEQEAKTTENVQENAEHDSDNFEYLTEQFADLKILRYQVPGFEDLSLKQKEMLYYLYEAALSGRDIMYDQNYKYNLAVRRTLENIINSYNGDKSGEDFKDFMIYTKRVWFSNGIHHHYQNTKIKPEFSKQYFSSLIKGSNKDAFPLDQNESLEDFTSKITEVIFNASIDGKKVNKSQGVDMIAESAVNFYGDNLTQSEVEAYYEKRSDPNDKTPISYGLNSKLVKENGELKEKVWKVGGMYTKAIEKIVYWLEKALEVCEDEKQKASLAALIDYYKTGDLKTFDKYSIAWVNDVTSPIDVVNGFIEVYNDPIGMRGSFESVLSFKDMEASKRIETIGNDAQWFEDQSPIMEEHKKKNVKGISAKVITVVVESGDASPSTPIGINLPNANWIRANHGSKSVQLGNIVHAYDMAKSGSGLLAEFCYDKAELERAKKYGSYADILHTDMHEVIGHASGKINPGIGTPKQTLKNYSSTLEEGRADLVALYYLMDEKLIELGVMESLDYGKAAYDDYIRNGLMMQLTRLAKGEHLEEDHMRNRQMVALWAYEKGKPENVIEKKQKEGKTFFVINDYEKLRLLFGELLKEVQRVKSEGDFKAGKALVEDYGVKVDPALHNEVLERYETLKIAPYGGFINPKLVAVKNDDGKITDVKVEYPFSFKDQMMEYARDYSFLPTYNK